MSSNIRRQKKEAYIKKAQVIKESTQGRENILTEDHQLLLLCEELAELNAAKHIDAEWWNRLNEAATVWEKFKSMAAQNLPRYKTGGAIFGQGKVKARAAQEMEKVMKTAAGATIEGLKDVFKKQPAPHFPNNKERADFIEGVVALAQAYETIKAAVEGCDIDYEAGQEIIVGLRKYVQNLMDIELHTVYTVAKEGEEGEDILSEEELEEISLKGIGQGIKKAAGKVAKSVKKGFSVDTGDEVLSGKKDTAVMKTLGSNKLPAMLLGIGAGLGGLSWISQTDWFRHLFDEGITTKTLSYAYDTIKQTLGSVQPGDGLTQTLNALMGSNLTSASSPQEMLDVIKEVGGADGIQGGIEAITAKGGLMGMPTEAKAVLEEIAKNPDGHGDTLGQMFQGNWAGTMKKAGDLLGTVQGGTLAQNVVNVTAKVAANYVVKTSALGVALIALGPWAAGVGVALVGAGALVKLARMYGAKKSRAATLNEILQRMDDLVIPTCGGTVLDPETGEEKKDDNIPGETGDQVEDKEEGGEDKEGEDQGDQEGIWKRLVDWVKGEDEQVPPEIIVKIPPEAFKKSRNLQFAYMLGLGGVPVPAFQYNPKTKEVNTKFTGDNSGAGPNARQIINIRKAGPQYFLNRLAAMYPGITHNKEIRVKALSPGEKGKRNIPDNLKVYKVPTSGKKVKVMSAEKLQELRDNPVAKWKYIFRGIKGITSQEAIALNKMWKNKRLPKFLKSNFTNYGFKYAAPPPAVGAEEELATAAQ